MKKVTAVALLFSFLFLLAGAGFACLMPEVESMGPSGDASSCCAIHCRIQTTPEVAKEFCDQSQREAGRIPVLSNAYQPDARSVLLPLDMLSSHAFPDPELWNPPFAVHSGFKPDVPPKVDRYLLCHTLLI